MYQQSETSDISNNKNSTDTLTNQETFVAVYKYAIKKSQNNLLSTFLMGVASGIFIGIAYVGSIQATKGWTGIPGLKYLVFGSVFTIAIVMIIFMGGEMFTSNSMMFLPMIKRQVKLGRFCNNLIIVLIGNIVGCFIMSVLTSLSGMMDDRAFLENAKGIYDHKLNSVWWKNFFSGILCNFLVAGSVYIAHASRSTIGKFALISIVIMVFALSGFSHIVANSYLWGLGPILGFYNKNISGNDFLKFGYQVQLPTLFGNFLGGGILLPVMYYFIFRKNLPSKIII